MGSQSVVVIHDASREVNLRIFYWALYVLSLKPGDILTLVIVLHQVITPMGYKSSVDSRHIMGANQKIIEAEVAKQKEKYLNNKELLEFFKLYKSKKVEFNIEVAIGSSPKKVALKISMKLNATWVMLDRKMKNDEEYFLQKLSCNISRMKRYNKIAHLRGRPDIYKEKQDNTYEIYAESIPVSENSINEQDPVSTESSPKCIDFLPTNHQMEKEEEGNHNDEAGCSADACDSCITEETSTAQPTKNQMDNTSKKLADEIQIHDKQDQNKEQIESMLDECESQNCLTCGGSTKGTPEQKNQSTKLNENSEEPISYYGAKNFYLGSAEEYKVCQQISSLCNSSDSG